MTMNTTPSLAELLQRTLDNGGYHGLMNESLDCACETGEIMPCECVDPIECRAGWRHPLHDTHDEMPLIWDQPPVDPVAAGQQSLFGSDEEESE